MRATCWLLAGLFACSAGPARGQTPPSPPPEERYFKQAPWKFTLGTDAALNLTNLEDGSTNEANDGATNFDTLWLRLYGKVTFKDQAELVLDLFGSSRSDALIYGLYVRIQPSPRLGVRLGLIPLVVGGWQDRAYPLRQPLINQPLFSQYLLAVRNDSIPSGVDELLTQRGAGARSRFSLGFPGRGAATSIYYEHCWDTGVELLGQAGGLRYRVALMEGSPGSPAPRSRDRKNGNSFEARLTYRFGEALRLGASWSRGAYLAPDVGPFLAPGRRTGDYRQELLGADARFTKGILEAHGEWVLNSYESPFIAERLKSHGYYGEAALTLRPGLQVAVRFSGLVFAEVVDSRGARRSWDFPARRLEAGAAYRFWRDHLAVKAVYQRTRVAQAPGRALEAIYAAQLSFSR